MSDEMPKDAVDEFAWLDLIACADVDIADNPYFTGAGHQLPNEEAELCRRCVVRRDCVRWAFSPEPKLHGYFGGIPAETRRQFISNERNGGPAAIEQAMEWIKNDPPRQL